ncbi:MAG TPA: hypothetical protein VGP94_04745, partial [Tepidisphaeraceae bacterium]|nr:hypothetical protein [Tepidisphaeraceae bacterium]
LPMEQIALAPKLFLEPSSFDARSHPVTPSSNPPPTSVPSTSGDFTSSGESLALNYSPGFSSNGPIFTGMELQLPEFSNYIVAGGDFSTVTSSIGGQLFNPGTHQGRHVHSENTPQVMTRSAFDGVSTISIGSGIIKGYGTAHAASELNQNGQVIADGSNQERTLDLWAVGVIKNSIDNSRAGHNGWFAQHKGKLVLPAVAFNDGEATWGEDPADPRLDLINSVRLKVNPDVIGSIKLSLLSADRTDYPALPANLKPVGLWQVEPIDVVLSGVDVMVRYDVDLANDLRLNSGLNVWGYDGEWKLADAGSVDSYNRLIRGHLGDVDYFAVAGSVQTPGYINGTPEPAAMLGLVCAGLILARRRRR